MQLALTKIELFSKFIACNSAIFIEEHIINNIYTSVIRKGGGYFGADRISCIRPYKDNKNT